MSGYILATLPPQRWILPPRLPPPPGPGSVVLPDTTVDHSYGDDPCDPCLVTLSLEVRVCVVLGDGVRQPRDVMSTDDPRGSEVPSPRQRQSFVSAEDTEGLRRGMVPPSVPSLTDDPKFPP